MNRQANLKLQSIYRATTDNVVIGVTVSCLGQVRSQCMWGDIHVGFKQTWSCPKLPTHIMAVLVQKIMGPNYVGKQNTKSLLIYRI